MNPNIPEQKIFQTAAEWAGYILELGVGIHKMYEVALPELRSVLAYAALRYIGTISADIKPNEAVYLGIDALEANSDLMVANRDELYDKVYQSIEAAANRSFRGYKGAVKRFVEPAFKAQFPDRDTVNLTQELAMAGAMCHAIIAQVANEQILAEQIQPAKDVFGFINNRLRPPVIEQRVYTDHDYFAVDGSLTELGYTQLMNRVREQEGGRGLTEEEWAQVRLYWSLRGKKFSEGSGGLREFYDWIMGVAEGEPVVIRQPEPKIKKPKEERRPQQRWPGLHFLRAIAGSIFG